MSRFFSSQLIYLGLVLLLYKFGVDILSVTINGMPMDEGQRLYSGNGIYYLGRDLDFIIERYRFFAPHSIWRLVPMCVVLPNILELVYIGFIQILGSLLLLKLCVAEPKSIEYSVGRSLQISFSMIIGLGVFVFFVEIFYFYMYKVDFLFTNFVNQNMEQKKLAAHPVYFLFYFLVGCLGAAIFEELFFRRFVFVFLRKKMPFILASVFSSLLFAFCHQFDLILLFQTFACGLICCFIYEQSQSIWGCILFHFIGNFFLFILPLFYPFELFR